MAAGQHATLRSPGCRTPEKGRHDTTTWCTTARASRRQPERHEVLSGWVPGRLRMSESERECVCGVVMGSVVGGDEQTNLHGWANTTQRRAAGNTPRACMHTHHRAWKAGEGTARHHHHSARQPPPATASYEGLSGWVPGRLRTSGRRGTVARAGAHSAGGRPATARPASLHGHSPYSTKAAKAWKPCNRCSNIYSSTNTRKLRGPSGAGRGAAAGTHAPHINGRRGKVRAWLLGAFPCLERPPGRG